MQIARDIAVFPWQLSFVFQFILQLVAKPLRIICVVPVFATVESNITTYAMQTIKKQANKTGPNRLTLLA